MNDEITGIIQAEIDGVATAQELARLDEAAASDPGIRDLRRQYAELAGAVGRLPRVAAPAGFTARVMAALPPPKGQTAPARVPLVKRLGRLVQDFMPQPRHRVAFAFALGVVLTLAVNLAVLDLSQPGTEMVSGTIKAPTGSTVALSDDRGVLEESWIGDTRHIAVQLASPMQLQIVVDDPSGDFPAVSAEATTGTLALTREAGGIVLSSDRADEIRFSVPGTDPVRVRVRSGDVTLLDWTASAKEQ